MRQVCNVAYVAQAETKIEDVDFERWERQLTAPPTGGPSGRVSRIAPQLDELFPPLTPPPPPLAAVEEPDEQSEEVA